jgi:hypothetical protein
MDRTVKLTINSNGPTDTTIREVEYEKPSLVYLSERKLRLRFEEGIECLNWDMLHIEGLEYNLEFNTHDWFVDINILEDSELGQELLIRLSGVEYRFEVMRPFTRV